MKPRLYNKSHSWKYNGYGFLNKCIKSQTTIETNGEYTLTIEVLPNDRLYNLLETGLLIRQKPNHSDTTQFFKINDIKIEKSGKAIITAPHIKNHFLNNVVKVTDMAAVSTLNFTGTASQINSKFLNNAIIHRNWKDTNDVEHSYSNVVELHGYSNDEHDPDNIQYIPLEPPFTFEEAYLGDTGFIKKFGGEMYFDNQKVHIYKNYGEVKPITLRFGSGISDYTQEMNSTETYDSLIVYAKVKGSNDKEFIGIAGYPDEAFNELIDALFGTEFLDNASFEDVSSSFSNITYEASGDSLTTEEKQRFKNTLHSIARDSYARKQKSMTQPSINIKVTSLSQYKKLQNVGLGDYIKVECGNKTVITEKVTKVVYDNLNEVYIEHDLGDKKLSLLDFIKL